VKAAVLLGSKDRILVALKIPYAVLVFEKDDTTTILHAKALADTCIRLVGNGLITEAEAAGFMALAHSYGLMNDAADVLAQLATRKLPKCKKTDCLNPFPHARIIRNRWDGVRMFYPIYSSELFLFLCLKLARENMMTPHELIFIGKSLQKLNLPMDQAAIDAKLTFMPPQMRESFNKYLADRRMEMHADIVADNMTADEEPAHFPGVSATDRPN
jgi:hypothetical protein